MSIISQKRDELVNSMEFTAELIQDDVQFNSSGVKLSVVTTDGKALKVSVRELVGMLISLNELAQRYGTRFIKEAPYTSLEELEALILETSDISSVTSAIQRYKAEGASELISHILGREAQRSEGKYSEKLKEVWSVGQLISIKEAYLDKG